MEPISPAIPKCECVRLARYAARATALAAAEWIVAVDLQGKLTRITANTDKGVMSHGTVAGSAEGPTSKQPGPDFAIFNRISTVI
jgi:hypothetical protein